MVAVTTEMLLLGAALAIIAAFKAGRVARLQDMLAAIVMGAVIGALAVGATAYYFEETARFSQMWAKAAPEEWAILPVLLGAAAAVFGTLTAKSRWE
jgi:integral membrane sensor domain MASE1